MAIRLEGPPKSTAADDFGAAQKILELDGRRVNLKRDRSNTSKFIARQIELEGQGIAPEEASRQAALEISNEQSDFGGGVLGGLKSFVSGFDPAGPGAFTAPIAERLLNQPQGLDAEKVRSQVEANQALTASRTGKTAVNKPTPGQKRRDADIAILKSDKKNEKKREARNRLSASEDLFDISEAPQEAIDKEFAKITKELKKLKIDVPGKKLDKMFGEKAFNQGLQDSIDQGLSEGIDPASTEAAFIKWWDEQAAKGDKIKGFGVEFQARSDFGEAGAIEKALSDGKINQEERDTFEKASRLRQGETEEDRQKRIDEMKKTLGL